MRKLGDYSEAGSNRTRTGGTRYGLEIAGLDRRHRHELDSFFFKGWTRDMILGVLAIVDARASSQNSNAETRAVPAVDPRTGTVTTWKAVKRSVDSLDWECARCRKSIVAKIGKLTAENLLCDVCLTLPGGVRAASSDDPLVASSVRFTDACKKHIRERRKYILAAAARNARILAGKGRQAPRA